MFVPIRLPLVVSYLKKLDINTAVGLDGIGAVVLKRMALVIDVPLSKIIRKIISTGIWPDVWMTHWISPLFKRGAPSNSENYRGIHLTPQVSKVVERFFAHSFITPLVRTLCIFGHNQFAYTKERGTRDMLAFLVLSWLLAFVKTQKIAFYRSDVAAAFDRVDKKVLLD